MVCDCHDRFPRIRKGTQDKSDLAQPPGQALSHWVSNSDRGWFTGVSLVRFKLREGSSLSMGNYIHEWGCHKSDFHKVTQYGSKMCHTSIDHTTELKSPYHLGYRLLLEDKPSEAMKKKA